MAAWSRGLGLDALVALGLASLAAPVRAQDTIPWPAANRLSVAATGRVTSRVGDALTLVYTLASSPGGEQAAQSFVLRTYVSQYSLDAPPPWFSMRGLVHDSAAAHWFALDDESMVQPGETQDGFAFTATGLLEVVPFRVQGAYDPPAGVEESGDPVQRPPSFWVNSASGWTIGVVPPAPDALPSDLLAMLRRQRARSCDLGWITSAGVCRSLQTKLDQAAAALSRGDREAARNQLRSFLEELEAQHGPGPGKHVTDNAYWLLKVNAEFLLAGLA